MDIRHQSRARIEHFENLEPLLYPEVSKNEAFFSTFFSVMSQITDAIYLRF